MHWTKEDFFVTPISKEDLIEVANLRVLLECHALKLSIDNGDTDWEGNLVSAHHKLSSMEQKMLSGDDSQRKIGKGMIGNFISLLSKRVVPEI